MVPVPLLCSIVDETKKLDEHLKSSIAEHLRSLEIEFQRYFPELRENDAILPRNLFLRLSMLLRFPMSYKTSFLILEIIHLHVIAFMKSRLRTFGVLCIHRTHY